MPDYILGLLTIPALAVVFAIVYLVINVAGYLRDEFLTQHPKFNRRVYAYRIKSISGHLSHELIGATVIERRNLGKEHTFILSFDGTRGTTATAERLPGGGIYQGGDSVHWDEETVETLDAFVEWRDNRPKAAAQDAS